MNSIAAEKAKSILIRKANKANKLGYWKRNGKDHTFKNVAGNYQPRNNRFYSKNFEFDLNTMTSTSYDWWYMLKPINGVLVRNTYNYSSSTSKHQGKLFGAMDALNIKADIKVCVRANITNKTELKDELLWNLAELKVKLKYCQKKNFKVYKKQIKDLERTLMQLRAHKIIDRVTKKEMAQLLTNAEFYRTARLERKKFAKKMSIKTSEVALTKFYSALRLVGAE